ncbi:unnamed protein product, partial [Owenia fusiformis]
MNNKVFLPSEHSVQEGHNENCSELILRLTGVFLQFSNQSGASWRIIIKIHGTEVYMCIVLQQVLVTPSPYILYLTSFGERWGSLGLNVKQLYFFKSVVF